MCRCACVWRTMRDMTTAAPMAIVMMPRASSTSRVQSANPSTRCRTDWKPSILQTQLKSGLIEHGRAAQLEPPQLAVSVRELHPHVVGEIPVDHRRDAPENPALDRPVGEVAVGELDQRRPRARAALDHRA